MKKLWLKRDMNPNRTRFGQLYKGDTVICLREHEDQALIQKGHVRAWVKMFNLSKEPV